jgi:hypothetical protein
MTTPTEPPTVDPKMIERLLREGALPVARAAALATPCRGRRRAPGTLASWIEHGKRGVYLEGYYGADKTWFTSAAALARFFARLTDMRLAGRRFRPTSFCADEAEAADRRRRAKAANEACTKIGSG